MVGVVSDVPARQGERPRNVAYVPFAQHPGRPAKLLVRAESDAGALASTVREAVAAVDHDLPLVDVRTLDQERRAMYDPYRVYAVIMSVFAALAVLLAAIGVYGVVAYSVGLRQREIGVRMALGAEPRHVLALVTGQGARLAVVGGVLGILASLGALRVLRSMLFGASPLDPLVLVAATLLLCATALAASFLPARRASRIDPLVALRAE